MKKVKLVLVAVTIFFNGFLLLNAKKAEAEGTPTKKGILGTYQGLSICHCPDSMENCWCN